MTSNPEFSDMDEFNQQMERLEYQEELLKDCFRMINPDDKIGSLMIPRRDHIRILINEINHLREQLKLTQIYDNSPI